jgi:hypothetical protein
VTRAIAEQRFYAEILEWLHNVLNLFDSDFEGQFALDEKDKRVGRLAVSVQIVGVVGRLSVDLLLRYSDFDDVVLVRYELFEYIF